MKYIKIYKTSILDGPGCRVALYVSGCRNHCEGCHNPQSWSFEFGKLFTQDTVTEILELLSRPYISGLSFVGGEPMEEENQAGLLWLAKLAKHLYPEKTIWCWTGYEWRDLLKGGKKHTKYTDELLGLTDVLVVGRYEKSLRDITDGNRWRGSTNQRVIDVAKSLKRRKAMPLSGIPNNDGDSVRA